MPHNRDYDRSRRRSNSYQRDNSINSFDHRELCRDQYRHGRPQQYSSRHHPSEYRYEDQRQHYQPDHHRGGQPSSSTPVSPAPLSQHQMELLHSLCIENLSANHGHNTSIANREVSAQPRPQHFDVTNLLNKREEKRTSDNFIAHLTQLRQLEGNSTVQVDSNLQPGMPPTNDHSKSSTSSLLLRIQQHSSQRDDQGGPNVSEEGDNRHGTNRKRSYNDDSDDEYVSRQRRQSEGDQNYRRHSAGQHWGRSLTRSPPTEHYVSRSPPRGGHHSSRSPPRGGHHSSRSPPRWYRRSRSPSRGASRVGPSADLHRKLRPVVESQRSLNSEKSQQIKVEVSKFLESLKKPVVSAASSATQVDSDEEVVRNEREVLRCLRGLMAAVTEQGECRGVAVGEVKMVPGWCEVMGSVERFARRHHDVFHVHTQSRQVFVFPRHVWRHVLEVNLRHIHEVLVQEGSLTVADLHQRLTCHPDPTISHFSPTLTLTDLPHFLSLYPRHVTMTEETLWAPGDRCLTPPLGDVPHTCDVDVALSTDVDVTPISCDVDVPQFNSDVSDAPFKVLEYLTDVVAASARRGCDAPRLVAAWRRLPPVARARVGTLARVVDDHPLDFAVHCTPGSTPLVFCTDIYSEVREGAVTAARKLVTDTKTVDEMWNSLSEQLRSSGLLLTPLRLLKFLLTLPDLVTLQSDLTTFTAVNDSS